MVLGMRGVKQEKGLKFAPRTSKASNGGNVPSAFKNKEGRKNDKLESGGSRAVYGSHAGDSKGTKKGMSGRRDVKIMNGGDSNESLGQGNRGIKSLNFGKKRKTSDAGLIRNEERNADNIAGRLKRKSSSKMRLVKYGDNIQQERPVTREKLHKLERSTQNDSLAGRKNPRQRNFLDKKASGVNVMKEYMKDEGVKNDKLKKNSKTKFEVRKESQQEQIKVATGSYGRLSKKIVPNKKNGAADAEGMDEQPKKKKRRIRLDPFDTSNKRLDDGISNSNNVQKKEDNSSSSEMKLSKNAEFRAIVPSPSILSFVEDNLLGRRREIEFRRAGYNTELPVPLDNIPHSSSSEREWIEEKVFSKKLTFFAAAKISSSFPPTDLPEIAFAGRSNVGKSSLLNALTRQWGVVRTSDKPGLTQTINFFKLASRLCLVDLPGYGFAYAKEDVKEAWEELVKEYVSTRVGLKRVCLLVDTKWGMKPRDHELIDLMERSQTKYQIVLTKTDTVFPIDVARRAMQIEESLKKKKSAVQPVMMVSSKTGAGIRSLRTALSKIARFVKP